MKTYNNIYNIEFKNDIESKYTDGYLKTKNIYKFKLTHHMVNLINLTNCNGLKKQFLPDDRELIFKEDEFIDVAREDDINPSIGIIHRYPNKVLFLLTLTCMSYCRFCYRKNKINDKDKVKNLNENEIKNAFSYIKNNDIREVIFSGGDPFVCKNSLIQNVTNYLVELECIKIVRWHTRCFSFCPNRIDSDLLSIIKRKKNSYIVTHVNHPEEISDDFIKAVNMCIDNGILVFSQTALLKDVNDSKEILGDLFTKLIQNRVKPYYLFHTDPVKGLSHFRVKLSDGISIYNSLYDRISGLAMPIYLFNIPGGYGHSIIDLGNLKKISEDKYEITTWDGKKVIYNDR